MSRVDSEDPARCPSLSCGTYLMLERTREGTRAGEREGGREARDRRQLREARRRDPRSLHPRGCETLQSHRASTLARVFFFFGVEAEDARAAGLGAGSGPGTSVAFLWCASPALIASSLGLLAPGALCTCWRRCQAARRPGRASAEARARTTDDWSHLHC